MFYLILIYLLGLNIAPFLFSELDMWHAQGYWAQIGLAILFSWSFFEKPKLPKRNIPLGVLHAWVALQTGWICFKGLKTGQYDTAHFFPYFNFLCIIILYQIFTGYLDKKKVEKILIYLKYAVYATLAVSALQIFGMSQFFARITTHHTHNNLVTGFIGNGTHLSGFLACCSPILFFKVKRVDWLALVLMVLVLLHTGTTIGDPSISGFVILPILFMYFFKKKWWAWVCLAICLTICLTLLPNIPPVFFKPQGRFALWSAYWPYFKQYAVSGTGLGAVNLINAQVYRPQIYGGGHMIVRQLHLEYYQIAFELGLIGLVLSLNLVYCFLKEKVFCEEQLALKAMVIGFLFSCLFNFPAHLWMPSIYAIWAYAGFHAIGEINGKSLKKRNT